MSDSASEPKSAAETHRGDAAQADASQARGGDERAAGWTAVVAASENHVIGRENGLPWHLSSDLRRFKQMTMGHCLLMGRKTFESIGRALPGRQTIVLSKSGFESPSSDVTVVSSPTAVQDAVEPGRKVMVVGGAEIYVTTLPFCDHVWLTRVRSHVEGDVFFPPLDVDQWRQVSSESFEAGPKDDWPTELQIWQRIASPVSIGA